MKGNKIAFVIILVLLALLVGYNVAIKQDNSSDQTTQQVLTIEDYESADETLARLGFASPDDFDALSDGSEIQEQYVSKLKEVTEKIDAADTEEKVADAHLSVALYLNLLGETQKAIEQYEYYMTKRTNSSTARNNLAWIYIEQGDYAKAEELFKKNVEENPNFSNWYINLADLYRSFIPEKKDEIPALFEEGIERRPNDTSFILYLAEYYESEKQYEEALTYYLRALEIKPNSEYAQVAVSDIRAKLDR